MNINNDVIVKVFNRWMDKFITDPSKFENNITAALNHFKEKNNGEPLTYGQRACATFNAFVEEINKDLE